jgi:hypothetical protein
MHEVALSNQSVTLITGTASSAVAIVAVAFTWWNTRATLKQQRALAFDDRKWQERQGVYQEIAEWLSTHYLLSKDNPLYEQDMFTPWTSDPGRALEAKARLFASEPVAKALADLRSSATNERSLIDAVKRSLDKAEEGGRLFPRELEKSFEWNAPDVTWKVNSLRRDWTKSLNDLEQALREAYGPL